MELRTAAQLKANIEHGLRVRGGCGAACCLLDPVPGAVKSACSCDSKKVRAALFWVRQVMLEVAPTEEIQGGAVTRLRTAVADVPVEIDGDIREYSFRELHEGAAPQTEALACLGCAASADADCTDGCWVPSVEDAVRDLSEAAANTLDAMPEALASMVALAHEYLDVAVCDHAKGECWCPQVAELRVAEALLPPAEVVFS